MFSYVHARGSADRVIRQTVTCDGWFPIPQINVTWTAVDREANRYMQMGQELRSRMVDLLYGGKMLLGLWFNLIEIQ